MSLLWFLWNRAHYTIPGECVAGTTGSAGTGNPQSLRSVGKTGISAEGVPFGIDWQIESLVVLTQLLERLR